MHLRIAVAMVLATIVAGPAYAQFDAICPAAWPIRLTGAACSGPNVGFVTRRPDGEAVCCAAPPRSANIPNGPTTYYGGPSQAQRIQAGMALGAAGLEIAGLLIGMLSGPSTDEKAEREAEMDRQYDAAWAPARREAAELNAGGMQAASAGNYRTALGDFKRAYERDPQTEGYHNNMLAMDALLILQEALALTAEKKFAPAFSEFAKASARAEEAQRPDIAARIQNYRQQLLGQLQRAPRAVQEQARPEQKCTPVNGTFVCD